MSRTELAHRSGDGIAVTLYWSRADDSITVVVEHVATDSSFELAVERSRALEAFYHPFAFAARRRPELIEVAA